MPLPLGKCFRGGRKLALVTLLTCMGSAQTHVHAAPELPAATAYQSAGTKAMQLRLEDIFRRSDGKLDPSKQAERVSYYKQLLNARKLSPADEALVQQQIAVEQLGAGDSEGAVDTLEHLRGDLAASHIALPPAAERSLGAQLAISYLRLGEQQNCAAMGHGQKACVFPLRASAQHKLPRGAEGAVRECAALLAKSPDDAQSRWLLNIAYMQLGRYPQDVPKQWLIPASRFDSEYPLPDFADVAGAAGVDVMGHAGGVILEDFDGDGWLDIMVTSSGPLDPMHLFHNDGDGTFSDVSAKAGLTGETGGLNLVLTDYNNDGHPDVLVLRGGWWGRQGVYPMSLLRNNGDGTFDDVTVEAGLLSPHPTQTAAWADFDNDGWLDLIVTHESTPDDPHPSQLFHNNHDGTFTDIAVPSGLSELGFVKGVAWGDFNNDGRPDLYVSVKGGKNRLFRNDGPKSDGPKGDGPRSDGPRSDGPQNASAEKLDSAHGWRFTDVTGRAGVASQTNSFATWFFDFDNDGWPDVFVGGYSTESGQDVGAFEIGKPFHAETPRLYRNNRDGTFTDVTQAMDLDRAILPMGANFGDLDDDGWLDIYLGTGDSTYQALLPNRMFRNDRGQRFQDVTTAGGFGHLQKGHGIAFGDIFHSGHEDIFEEMGGALPGDSYQSVLYKNPGNANHSICLELVGVQTNRAAFGARLDVTFKTPAGERHIFRTVGYGSSFGGNPLQQHIGLGAATEVEQVEVFWPASRKTQRFFHLAADASFRLREDQDLAIPVKVAELRQARRADGNR